MDGMKNLDSYLTQSDDVNWDPRITDEWIQADALGDIDPSDGDYLLYLGDPDATPVEIIGTIDGVEASEDGKHWIVSFVELAYPVLIKNNTEKLDRA